MSVPRFLSFLKGGKGSVVGIDIGSSAVKVVQIRREKGVAVLETYGSLAIGPYVEGAEIGQYANASEEVLHTVLIGTFTRGKSYRISSMHIYTISFQLDIAH